MKNSEKKKELIRSIKFLLFSISAGLIQMGSFALFKELLGWTNWLSYLLALVLSVLWNFTLNRKFTFKSANNVPVAMFKVACYYAVFTPLSTLLERLLADTLGWNGYLVTFINMALNLTLEYLYDTFIVYRGDMDNNDVAKKDAEKEKKRSAE